MKDFPVPKLPIGGYEHKQVVEMLVIQLEISLWNFTMKFTSQAIIGYVPVDSLSSYFG